MRKVHYLSLIILLTSCLESEVIHFETAQPHGIKEANIFSKRVRGQYLNCFDSEDLLIISEKLIINHQTIKFKYHKNNLEIDSTIVINKEVDAEIISLFQSHGYNINIEHDTIYTSYTNIDTVFKISDKQKLKKFKGDYFLNFKKESSHWSVNKLSISKDTLLIGQISPSDSLLQFDFVKKENINNTRTTRYLINSNKKEFKKILRLNTFNSCKCYLKKD